MNSQKNSLLVILHYLACAADEFESVYGFDNEVQHVFNEMEGSIHDLKNSIEYYLNKIEDK